MQMTAGFAWGAGDFAVAGVLLAGAGLGYGLLTAKAANGWYRAAAGLAIAAVLLLVWATLAVGLVGEPDEPANAMYLGVLAVGAAGALLARGRQERMAHALLATALAQAVVGAVVLVSGLGAPANDAREIIVGNGLFVALFLGSAWLFRRSAREPARAEGSRR